MNKIEKFIDDLLEKRLDFDVNTVKDFDFTTKEALDIFDILRTNIVDKKDRKTIANVQSVIFLSNMHYFGVTREIFQNHLETNYEKQTTF